MDTSMNAKLPATTSSAVIKFCITFLCLVVIANSSMDHIKNRVRRKVVFSKSSKFFFRLNGKDNVLNQTNIFAHGWAIRINYDLPESLPKRHKFFKRNVHRDLFEIGNQHAPAELSCIMKYVCEMVEMVQQSETCGILCGIGRIIGRSQGMEADFFKNLLDKCDHHINACPHTFYHSSMFSYG